MIVMPNMPLTSDEKINDFLCSFIQKAISDKIIEYISYYDEGDTEAIECLFPITFPEDNIDEMLHIIKGLYSLIISDKHWVPSLIMEYVMAKIIIIEARKFYDDLLNFENNMDEYKKFELSDEENRKMQNQSIDIPFTEKLKAEYIDARVKYWKEDMGINDDNLSEDDIKEISIEREYAKEVIENCWHFSKSWLDWCFWDDDYLMMDDISVGEIKNSWINDAIGVIGKEKDAGDFILPDDWLHSKDFRFVNEKPEEEW